MISLNLLIIKINQTCENIYKDIYDNEEIIKKWKKNNHNEENWYFYLREIIEAVVYESIYLKIFNNDEKDCPKNFQIYEKFNVLQKILNPDVLDIPFIIRAPSVFLKFENGSNSLKKKIK